MKQEDKGWIAIWGLVVVIGILSIIMGLVAR